MCWALPYCKKMAYFGNCSLGVWQSICLLLLLGGTAMRSHRSGWWRARVSHSLAHFYKSNQGTRSRYHAGHICSFNRFGLTYFEVLYLGARAFRVLMSLRMRPGWYRVGQASTELCVWPVPLEQGKRVVPATPASGRWPQARPYSYPQAELEARLATRDPSQK